MMGSFRELVAVLIFAVASAAYALPFTGLTMFGDSLSDTGNAFLATGTVTTAPFPIVPSAPYMRPAPLEPALSNGPVWLEVVGSALGLPVAPSRAGGTNYAFAGADSGPLPFVPPTPPPTLLQQFFGPAPAFFDGGPIVPTDLYGVWAGSNDIRGALGVYAAVFNNDPANAPAALAAASAVVNAGVANVALVLNALAAGGAQNILSINVPDVGLAPAANVPFQPAGIADLARQLAAGFNLGLATAINGIESAYGVNIIEVDIFTLLHGMVNDPGAVGLTNVTDPCIFGANTNTCADPDTYLFWDGLHPTAAGHRLIAGAVLLKLLPEPGTIGLLFVGMLGLLVGARRSRR
jgi:phospholipase/lecithinase/hemolysin